MTGCGVAVIRPGRSRRCRGVGHAGTRAELELYDSGGDGWLTENDLQQYVEDLLPRLPALTGLLEAFVHFYKARPPAAAHRTAPRRAAPRRTAPRRAAPRRTAPRRAAPRTAPRTAPRRTAHRR
jgi:hypothetical protein